MIVTLWYDRIDWLNGWCQEYQDALKNQFNWNEQLIEYFHHCSSQELLQLSGLQWLVKPIDEFEEGGVHIYTMSLPQLIPSNHWGGPIHSFRNISEKAKQLIREGKLTLYISGDREGWPCSRYMKSLLTAIREAGFEHCEIYHSTGNVDWQDDWEEWKSANLELVGNFAFAGVFSHDYFERLTCSYYLLRISPDPQQIHDETERTRNFLSFNRMARPHRFALYSEVLRNNLLDNSFFSFHGVMPWNKYTSENVPVEPTCYSEIVNHIFNNYKEKNDWLDKCISEELIVKRTIDYNEENIPGLFAYANETQGLYDNSYFSLISETLFVEPGRFITEKTYKSLFAGHPFIFIGQSGILRLLKEHGYKTFPEMFDESYDDIEDHSERFNAVINEVIKFCNKSDEEKQEIYKTVLPSIEHNQKLFFSDTRKHAWQKQVQSMLAKIGKTDEENLDKNKT